MLPGHLSVRSMLGLRTVATLLVLAVGCGSKPGIALLTRPDGPPVSVGRYPGRYELISANHPLDQRASDWRTDIEQHERVLRELVRKQFAAKTPLEFDHMFTAYDSTAGRVLLRYFAPAVDPSEIAGWEVMLVYATDGRLAEAFVDELPLE